ncbi:MAG: Rdx family protein [Myxococcales bacterium]|nr:Rdx family protein [Myxococcales bacterium]
MASARGVTAALVPGQSGEFTVLVDGEKVWDKYERGRFPEHAEVVDQL